MKFGLTVPPVPADPEVENKDVNKISLVSYRFYVSIHTNTSTRTRTSSSTVQYSYKYEYEYNFSGYADPFQQHDRPPKSSSTWAAGR